MPNCKECGKPIFWIVMAISGKTIPVDKEPVSVIQVEGASGRMIQAYTSHLQTCPERKTSWIAPNE